MALCCSHIWTYHSAVGLPYRCSRLPLSLSPLDPVLVLRSSVWGVGETTAGPSCLDPDQRGWGGEMSMEMEMELEVKLGLGSGGRGRKGRGRRQRPL